MQEQAREACKPKLIDSVGNGDGNQQECDRQDKIKSAKCKKRAKSGGGQHTAIVAAADQHCELSDDTGIDSDGSADHQLMEAENFGDKKADEFIQGSSSSSSGGFPDDSELEEDEENADGVGESNSEFEEESIGRKQDPSKALKALVLAPTRELALQVCKQLQIVGRVCGFWVVPIVGGLAHVKQERMLKSELTKNGTVLWN